MCSGGNDATLLLDRSGERILSADGSRFDPVAGVWRPLDNGPAEGEPITPGEAVAWLGRNPATACRVPVGVIGGREAREDQTAFAEALGRGLAGMGLHVVCGGRQGIMEAACRGVAAAGGISVGILPDADPAAANPHVTVAVATGIGIARNAIVARAALCLVAIGGGYGTISEAAFGLQFGKAVFSVLDGPSLPGVIACRDLDTVLDGVARVVLHLPVSGGVS